MPSKKIVGRMVNMQNYHLDDSQYGSLWYLKHFRILTLYAFMSIQDELCSPLAFPCSHDFVGGVR